MASVEKFGQYLLRNQVVSQDQLNEALQCQVIFGGRLGTNLVELGYLTLDDLARLLSRRSGYPAASPEELEELGRDILTALPRATIEKFKIIPIRIEAKTLHLAVCDPTDVKTMDEIQFATGMRIKPYLLPELRMYYLLEKHYGIKRDIRYIRLGRSLSRGKYAGAMVGVPATVQAGAVAVAVAAGGAPVAVPVSTSAGAVPEGAGPEQTPGSVELELKGFRKLREGEELTDEETHQEQMKSMLSSGTLAEQANSGTAKMRAAVVDPTPAEGMTPPMASAAVPLVANRLETVRPSGNGATSSIPVVMGTPVAAAAPAAAPAAPEPAPIPLVHLDETHLEPIEPIEAKPAAPSAAPIPFPPPANADEATALKATLSTAQDRDGAASAALRLGRGRAAVVAFFIVNKGILTGWKGAGGALDHQGIESVMLPASADSILKNPAAGIHFQGPVPRGGLNDRLLAALGRGPGVHAMVIPITLGTRVVNLLYADNGAEAMAPEAQASLQMVGREMSAAYERIILAKKKSPS